MEPLAFISDIHGNLEALDRVLKLVDSLGIDNVYCLGDLVGYGPNPGECIELTIERCSGIVAGNHDWAVVGKTPLEDFNPVARTAIHWTMKRLSWHQLRLLKALPLTLSLDSLFLVHSSPLMPHQWLYIMDEFSASLALERRPEKVILVGHTHVPQAYREKGEKVETISFPFKLEKDARYLVNVGSVGQPRDGDPRACCVVMEEGEVRLERIPYPVQETARKIKERGLPSILAYRIQEGW